MNLFIHRLIAISLCLTPVTLTVASQPSWGQTQTLEMTIQKLTQKATEQTEQGLSVQALETWQKILVIAQQHDKKALEAFTLVGLGFNYHELKQPEKAIDCYQKALPIAQRLGDRRIIGATFNNMGASYQRLGKYQEALDYYTRALPITQELEKLTDIAKTLNNMGEVYTLTGQRATASQYYQEALFLAKKAGDPLLEQKIRKNIDQN
jgi:tetratricopeptide (TPR) repeat protein